MSSLLSMKKISNIKIGIEMLGLVLVLGLFSVICRTDLLADRMANVKTWIDRSASPANMNLAYNANVVNMTTIFHTVRTVGNFGPGIIAEEYDRLVTDLVYLIGYSPVILGIVYDPTTTKWIDTDTLQVDYTIAITTGAIFVPSFSYAYSQSGFRFTERIVFDSNSKLIKLGYTIQDIAADKLFALTSSQLPPEFICAGVIFPACNVTNATGYNYLQDTGFASLTDCITFLYSLSPNNPCPYSQRSNTAACRALHGFSSFFLPNIHCSHVKPISMACKDSCLPACANCDTNARCVPTFPVITNNPVYVCQCNNGYVGNGTNCVAKTCLYGNCPALYGSYDCTSGRCACTETFTPVPTIANNSNNLCSCSAPSKIVYNNSKPICVPQGRCIKNQWECNLQTYTRVKCLPQDNTFTLFGACICNYGFLGGWEYPCTCPANKRVVWSASLDGDACLSSNECTVNWHCQTNNCAIVPGQKVGICI